MIKKHFDNVSEEYEGVFDYVSPKIKINEEWNIKVIEPLYKWEILMKGKKIHDCFWYNQPAIRDIIWKPLRKWNVEFIDKQTVQVIKDIKKWSIIIFSEDGQNKPLLFRAPNIFVYMISFVLLSLFLCFLSMWLVVCWFYLYDYLVTN